MVLATILCSLAVFFIAAQVATLALAWFRCGPRARRVAPRATYGAMPAVTVVRPLRGVEAFSRETIAAAFALDYPAYELLFCVADATDPVIPLVEAAIAAHPTSAARLLVGDDRIGINPKLNNMVKGWRHAAHDRIVFIDSNVLVPPGFLTRLVATFRPDTGAVSAPPCGIMPIGFGAHLECAFLNTHEARWQYVVDTFGSGFAQGKTLFYRKCDLDRHSMLDLASEPAEDAATTKMVRAAGLRVRLAPPSPQPLGVRGLSEVWGRQIRWARLRRATFPLEFLPEILSGSVVPVVVAAAAAAMLGWSVPLTVSAYLAVWYVAEIAVAAASRWPVTWQTPFASVLRDLLLPVLWICGWTGHSINWNGNTMKMDARSVRARGKIEPGDLRHEEIV